MSEHISKRNVISTDAAPAAIGPYSQAVQNSCLIFTSGQLPIDPKTGAFAGDSIEEQTRQSLENVKAVLQAADLTLENILKTTVFLSDMNNFAGMNEVYASFFSEGNFPARSAVEVARLPKDALVEIEAIAAK
ncbi:MAG: RidA family protein [Spirochaetales bacterium]